MMIINLNHEIILHPQPEDVDTITVHARVEGYDSTFTATNFLEEFNEDECHSKENLNYFLMASGINDDDTTNGIIKLIVYVSEVTSPASSGYFPGCALKVWLSLVYDDIQIEDAVQASFEESYNIRFRSASMLVVESLPRKLYEKTSSTDEKCAVCLEEFNNGSRVVTLPCEHYFDDECVVKWFETGHFCPLCRFELPCQDQ
ncbi:E3 ubiquitin-protein ligase RING1-like [Cardamine amara subsp. amara]|uniref:RING-type E3 ubiquitin transferase n=1 Tax=Cardamine amara subsp. amara TaxID=228776 RepID=A0ABD1B1N4_CARAN